MKTGISFLDKIMKYTYNFSPILHNRIVLYFLCILAIADIIYFTSVNDIRSLIILVLVGILTSFFSKNMIVILVLALSVTHILKYGVDNTYEGMKEGKDDGKDNGKDDGKDNGKDNEVDTEKTGTDKKTKPTKKEMMTELKKYEGVQGEIADSMEKITPLLDKTEKFIEKFEAYSGITGFTDDLKRDVKKGIDPTPKIEAMKERLLAKSRNANK